MFTIAIDPRSFAGDAFFGADLSRIENWICASPPLDPSQPVVLPGEIENHILRQREAGGIPFDNTTWTEFADVADSLGVAVEAGL